jgi:ABC-type uncharacterized transport system fused permease/ATPase subunit
MKSKFILLAWFGGEAVAYTAVLFWFVGISLSLDITLACIITGGFYTFRQVKYNMMLFNINDTELVRVSAVANRLEELVHELKGELEEEHNEIDDLKDKTIRSEYQFDEITVHEITGRFSTIEDQLKQLQERLKSADAKAD